MKSYPKVNESPNLVTLVAAEVAFSGHEGGLNNFELMLRIFLLSLPTSRSMPFVNTGLTLGWWWCEVGWESFGQMEAGKLDAIFDVETYSGC